jgi:hypothetical protein
MRQIIWILLLVMFVTLASCLPPPDDPFKPDPGDDDPVVQPPDPEWTFCADEGNFCNFIGTALVRYGYNESYDYMYQEHTDGVMCENAVFGDPLKGETKECHYSFSGDGPKPIDGLSIINPYRNVDFSTYKAYIANMHTHTTESDGGMPVSHVVGNYSNAGYDILAITDHDDWLPVTTTWRWHDYPGFALTPTVVNRVGTEESSAFYGTLGRRGVLAVRANELSYCHHTGSFFVEYGTRGCPTGREDTYLAEITARGGLAMFFHPGRYTRTSEWYNGLIDKYRNTVVGLEVYNNGNRYPQDRDLWDTINRNRSPNDHVWGYSNDDMHSASNMFRNYNHFYMRENTEEELRRAMREGSSTFSYEPGRSGQSLAPIVTNIRVSGSVITVTAQNYTHFEWYDDTGNVLSRSHEIDVGIVESSFVRAMMNNTYGRTYTQPFGIVQ